MARLIDAEKLILHLNDYALQESPSGNESTGERRISEMVYSAIQNCMKAVEDAPTAYDVEKVVEELMIIHDEGYCPNEGGLECVLDKTCSDCYREKITEIIRKGGVE